MSKRNVSFDIINIMACIFVIAIHHNGLVHTFSDTVAWRQSLVAECVFYCCVPLFMMLSGANLIGYLDKYPTSVFARKRFSRVVVPWLFWSVVILFDKMRLGMIVLQEPYIKNALDMIFSFQVEGTYWYFAALFPVYFFMPVLSALRNDRKTLWYIVGVNFFFCSVYPLIAKLFHLGFSLNPSLGGSLAIYVVLGYLLKDWKPSRKELGLIWVLACMCLLFRYGYTLHFSLLAGETDTSIKGYQYFHAVFPSVAVFVTVNSIEWETLLSDRVKGLLQTISACSFGIYLVHRIVMRYELMFTGLSESRLLWRVACIPVTYFVSLALVYAIRKIPVAKKLVG